MSHQTELQGFLSIKIPPKMRGFLPWKVWKRQWVSIRCQPSGGIDLILGRNSQNVLHILQSDIIVRTHSRSHLYAFGVFPREGAAAYFCLAGSSETDSQKWIATLRKLLRPPLLPVEENEFTVSVIDNTFTRTSGFPGLYGILRVTDTGITITDPSTSRIRAHWLWRQMSHLYVPSAYCGEDRGRICTILTSREFPTGVGRIRLFCLEAMDLAKTLTHGRKSNFIKFNSPKRTIPYRHHTFSYDFRFKESNSSPTSWIHFPRRRTSLSESMKYGRRISKSEGNLMSLFDQLENASSECSDSGFILDFYNSLFSACFSDNEDKSSGESSNGSPTSRKVATNVTSSGTTVNGHFLQRQVPIQESTHVYQKLRFETDDEEIGPMQDSGLSRKFSPRRQSGVSVASGVYEEIDELSICFTSSLNTVEENQMDSPPPLPPRRDAYHKSLRRNMYENVATLPLPSFQSKFISRSAGNTPLPSPPSLSRTPSSAEFLTSSWQKEDEEESYYLPMNPCTRHLGVFHKNNFTREANDDQIYVVMSSFKKDQT